MRTLKAIRFWIVAFSIIIWNTMRGRTWHMICVDFHCGDDANGNTIRKQLIARRDIHGYGVYWNRIGTP